MGEEAEHQLQREIYGTGSKAQGETSLPPNFENWPTEHTRVPPSLNFGFTADQLVQYTEEERKLILEWVPYCLGRRSSYLDDAIVYSPDDVLAHARSHMTSQLNDMRKAQAVKNENEAVEFAARIKQWEEECRKFNAETDAARKVWKDAVGQFKELELQWKKYITEKREAFRVMNARSSPVRPTRNKA